MLSELTQRIDRNFPDATALHTKINDFIRGYNQKLFSLTSQLSEQRRRKTEKARKWTEMGEKCRCGTQRATALTKVLSEQRRTFKASLEEKDFALLKANNSSVWCRV